ncbi:hypothetical protein SAMN06296241_1607 [Salinimicrobium sediminis]|uniref:Uncharacterized protein n=1 Tax=Salinimicrobium sediminis TaxID=1343891 RepID=A0A285X3Y9_9FLAO|nr:hypothetical protein [Salinimicrobium sediminis]SOC80063.1 hypothetical protein SAMN06296241_1607 [Salinimicrobium sediminis]
MRSRKQLSTEDSSKFLLLGSIIAICIAFSPYLFYLYEIFPSGKVWENSFFVYESKYYESVNVAVWTYLGKITPLFLLLIWFFTCKHWWYHVILVPTIMYGYQLIVAFYQDAYMDQSIFLDTNGLLYLAPFFIVILSIVYLIRIRVFDRIYGIDLSEIERENISPFSPFSDKEYQEIKEFREEADVEDNIQEEYYVKL